MFKNCRIFGLIAALVRVQYALSAAGVFLKRRRSGCRAHKNLSGPPACAEFNRGHARNRAWVAAGDPNRKIKDWSKTKPQ